MIQRTLSASSSGSELFSITNLLSWSGKRHVPLVLQSEVAECGLACLAMIASYYGRQINLPLLRKKVTLDAQGMSLKQLIEVANEQQLSCRALKCSLDDIGQLHLPCILHWNMDHFVVLTNITKNAVYINDPEVGKRKLSIKDFSDSFTGIALELMPTTEFKKQDIRVVMKMNQLWEKIVGLKRSLAALFALSIIMQVSALLSPYYMQWVIDQVLLSQDQPLLVILALGFAMLMLIQVGVSTFRSWIVLRFSSALNLQMGANLFHHLLRLPVSYFEKRHIGDVVSRFGALGSIQELITTGLIEAIIDGLMATVVLIMMYLYNPTLTAIVVGIMLLSSLLQIAFYYPNRRITEESIVAEAKGDSTFLESVRAIQTIKLFSHEASRMNTWINRYADVINSQIRLGKLGLAESTLNQLLLGFESIIIIYLGAVAVMDSQLTVGMLLAFIAYKSQFISSTDRFIDKVLDFKLLSLHLERLSDIALQEQEQSLFNGASSPHIVQGHIRLENVSFRYSSNSEWILKDVSLDISAGESVAITGPSGCGKTTLLKIILGLLKPTSGRIYLDNVEISDFNLNEYRKHFGAVMQNDVLLSGTLAENITMLDSNYDEHKLEESCHLACILRDIHSLPMGFHSLVGDMGNHFSGGQLQRIFLARALYKEPQVLCLDESTSHLDHQNEGWINDNINSLSITRILIAHRKETINSVDRVINLNFHGDQQAPVLEPPLGSSPSTSQCT
ncbi:peptidase domain-containing ABC transporter [Photobacterium sp. OFAV2-7]|uniref:peptidase domain-containing ABC transporter n=1 Tax=Photobacterium sp. OFAV2-7 TaxID=2917748 RepID=UPI001EF671E9|nr:peptidase domain-containing ABC transporter [Photobacterium sp. OFAV2-7]MCG7587977.1 peptidase domain-containing ABC transporter [Photobacterium sp. OFAV2-7]